MPLTKIGIGTTAGDGTGDPLRTAFTKINTAFDQIDANETALDAKAPLTVARTAQTGTAYTLALADAGRVVTMSNAAANTLTIPANATVAFPVGTLINVVQIGDGVTTVTGATGVTVNGASAGSAEISAKWQGLSLYKLAENEWVASGALA